MDDRAKPRARAARMLRPDMQRGALSVLLAGALAAGWGCSSAPAPSSPAHPATPTQQVLPRIGVALGGGGARGFAHVGVLRVLEQERIPIDLVVGASVGSLVGALYADTGRVLDAEFLAVAVTAEDLFDYRALAFFSGGLAEGKGLVRFLDEHLRNRSIENMKVRFGAVATELRTGRTVVFERGAVAAAVRASSAIPGVFVPVEIEGVTYVDGGVTDPIPADVARRMGAEVVIAVAIPAEVPATTPSNPLAVAYHAVSLMSAEIASCRGAEADVLITPQVGDVPFDDFTQKKRLIEAGELAARAALPQIHRAIAAHTRAVAPGS